MIVGALDKALLSFWESFCLRFAFRGLFPFLRRTNLFGMIDIFMLLSFASFIEVNLPLQVAGTSGKALLEGGSDDEGASTEAQGRAIIEVLGREKRNEVLAALYMVRTDVSVSVRQVSFHFPAFAFQISFLFSCQVWLNYCVILIDCHLFVFLLEQAALHVWKTIVANTPKTLKEILPVLMDTLITSLASPSSERRQVCYFLCIYLFETIL